MRIYQNRYAGECFCCGKKVQEMEGLAFKGESDRRYSTVCNSSACIGEAPVEVQNRANEKPRREITSTGQIFMPYEAEALPILRGMPNARFDRTDKCWTVSVEPKDRARVVDGCKRLNLEMPDGFEVVELSNADLKAVKRAIIGGAYGYQQEGVRFLSQHDRALLGDDMGLGKTFQSVMAIEDRAIVVCPATLKLNWANEVRKWRSDLTPRVCQGRDGFRLPASGDVVIINYDILPKEFDPTDKYGTEHNTPELWVKVLKKTTAIFDEAHLCKSYKATRSKRAKVLASVCKNAWALTGTPLMSNPFDLWGVLNTFGMAQTVFGSWHGFLRNMDGVKGRFGYQFGTPDESVPERMRRVMLRRMKDEVLSDLPQKQIQDLVVGLSGNLKSQVSKAWRKMQELNLDQLPQFDAFSEIRASLASDRIPALLELVEGFEEANEPVVVFSAHRAPVEALSLRDGWATIMGDTSQKDRQKAVEDFQEGNLKGIACTIKAGGTGITLTRASKMIFCDLEWNPALNAQAEDRIRRIGQEADSLQYIRLVSDHPMDHHVLRLLDRKQSLIEEAVENEAEQLESTAKTGGVNIVQETVEQRDARISASKNAKTVAKNQKKVMANKSSWVSRMNGFSNTPIPFSVKKTVPHAVAYMQSVCDGAFSEDGQGFNKPDAAIMHTITTSQLLSNDEDLIRFCWWTLRKYKGQCEERFPALY
tara:strand:- start:5918 stop:8032 length:2115 start_codon:yes stop_codon:yes gene_type:complete